MLKRLSNVLKKRDWFGVILELIILIVGITIAYQLNVRQAEFAQKKDQKQLLKNIAIEVEVNLIIENGQGDSTYRKELVEKLEMFVDSLYDPKDIQKEFVEDQMVFLMRTSLIKFQTRYLDAYLSDKQVSEDPILTTMFIDLQHSLTSANLVSELSLEQKNKHFYEYLGDAFDFYEEEVVDLETFKSMRFKNNLMILLTYEETTNNILEQALKQLLNVKEYLTDKIDGFNPEQIIKEME